MGKTYSISESAVRFAITEAFGDATRETLKIAGSKDFYMKIPAIWDLVEHYVSDLLSGTKNDEEVDVIQIANMISEIAKKENQNNGNQFSEFFFGHAQKLLNMTVKYIYVGICALPDLQQYHVLFERCHCPMDDVMCNKVKAQLQIWINSKDTSDHDKCGMREWCSVLKDYIAWSKIDGENIERQYIAFQDAVAFIAKKLGCSSLEYDINSWAK